jgi:hypothetical protein
VVLGSASGAGSANGYAFRLADSSTAPAFNSVGSTGAPTSFNMLQNGQSILAGAQTVAANIASPYLNLLDEKGVPLNTVFPTATSALNFALPLRDGRILISGAFTTCRRRRGHQHPRPTTAW